MKILDVGINDAYYEDRALLIGKTGHWDITKHESGFQEEEGFEAGGWIMDESIQFSEGAIKDFYFASVKTGDGMSDKEFINFLWRLLWDDLSDGDTPSKDDIEILRKELNDRGIIDGDFPA